MRRKLSILLSIMLLAAFALNGCGKSGSVLDQAAWRDDTVPSDGIVYIEPEMVSLAAELSGTSASQAASKAAFELANQQRTAAGLSALTWNSGLEQASAVRAVEASQSFSHTRPDGSDWWTVNSNLMYGENLAYNYADANSVVSAWMASPTHKANIVNGEFTTVGMAAYQTAGGVWYWAQEFGY